ncbi:hypothetical protein [Alterisphingorhabdus coralli]|uniref:Fido domain-containing protein n=1 Tax=Alterisphingorhabdus coralli TaxID=3071408 RepID=A0AA97FBC8_9SPHN|nr:hypothetical protein [Parasphingorhabdus sp. SCSIO 66989]WOE76732.1 hypothetical protein RB602_15210 [Parasphingorhabdus sp. SCSIO 66989]
MSIAFYVYKDSRLPVNSRNLRSADEIDAALSEIETEQLEAAKSADQDFAGQAGFIALHKFLYGDFFRHAGKYRNHLHPQPTPQHSQTYLIDEDLFVIFRDYAISPSSTKRELATWAYEICLTQPFYYTTEFTACAYMHLVADAPMIDKRALATAAQNAQASANPSAIEALFT